MEFHQKYHKYKVKEFFGSANPMVGAGASYILSSCTIKHVDKINLSLGFGTQFFTPKKAREMVDKIKEKVETIANMHIDYKSKL